MKCRKVSKVALDTPWDTVTGCDTSQITGVCDGGRDDWARESMILHHIAKKSALHQAILNLKIWKMFRVVSRTLYWKTWDQLQWILVYSVVQEAVKKLAHILKCISHSQFMPQTVIFAQIATKLGQGMPYTMVIIVLIFIYVTCVKLQGLLSEWPKERPVSQGVSHDCIWCQRLLHFILSLRVLSRSVLSTYPSSVTADLVYSF
jgi:hypothetical protein